MTPKLPILTLATTLALTLATQTHAFGNDDHWVSAFGQGTKEAAINSGPGNQIYVACQQGSIYPSSITFSLSGRLSTGDNVTLTFDDLPPETFTLWNGVIPSDCRACAGNFTTVRDKLKKHSNVHVLFENGDAARFSLTGAAAAIGECKAAY